MHNDKHILSFLLYESVISMPAHATIMFKAAACMEAKKRKRGALYIYFIYTQVNIYGISILCTYFKMKKNPAIALNIKNGNET